MTQLRSTDLAIISGGVSTAQTAQARQVCNRTQFDWMAAHMVPDTGLHPGVQRHVVVHDAQMCGFPMPK